MDKSTLYQHISSSFNSELEGLRNDVLAMGGLVEEQLARACVALLKGDLDAATLTIKNDYKVNSAEVAIDEECARIIAMRQPAASDLRFITMVIKTITDLERMGDEAVKISQMALSLSEDYSDQKTLLLARVTPLSEAVTEMLGQSLNAFARMDVDAALQLPLAEQKANAEHDGVMQYMLEHMQGNPNKLKSALDVMWAARALERIADHAKNISEYVIYMVKGKDVRHTRPEQVRAELGYVR